ncbi:MAG: type III secretion system inner membrane ring lipoprotein SctJ [Betaproteobacteria bacterium]
MLQQGKRALLRVSAILAVCLVVSGCKTELYSDMTQAEANEMLMVLAEASIEASKVLGGDKLWKIEVDKADLARAVRALRSQGLPRERFASMGEVFKREGLVSSPSEERVRLMYAMQQELSNTLSRIDGVITARVHVAIPANDPLASNIKPASAAVQVLHRPDAKLESIGAAIKELVTRSVEGLPYDNVSVVFLPIARPVVGGARGSDAGSTALLLTIGSILSVAIAGALIVWRFGHPLGSALPQLRLRLRSRSRDSAALRQEGARQVAPAGAAE